MLAVLSLQNCQYEYIPQLQTHNAHLASSQAIASTENGMHTAIVQYPFYIHNPIKTRTATYSKTFPPDSVDKIVL